MTTGEAAGRVAAAPLEPVTRSWSARFAMVWLGVWAASLVPIQLALPAQLLVISPKHHVGDFALVNGAVGVAAIVTLPVFGALCDRTRTRYGARRTWVLGGLVVFVVGLVLTGAQTHLLGLVVCWVLAQVGNNAMATGLTAVVADRVPERQRGLISGVIYAPQAVGVVIGLAALTGLSDASRFVLLYVLLAAALVVLALPFVLAYRERFVPSEGPLTLGTLLASLYVPVRDNPDYTWAFWSRLLVNVGNALGTTYLLFFLRDYLHVADPEGSLLPVVAIYLVFTLVATVLGGILSDRLGRRRVFVAVAAVLQATAGILVAVSPTFTMTLVAGGLLGAGYGAYMSVDQALVTAVLPDPADRAKDLGTMNIGSVGPQMFGPVLASAVILLASYRVLFLAAGLFTLVGAWMVYRIQSVR